MTATIQLQARNGPATFEADGQLPLLLTGLRAGVGLPYECGSGTCGSCKATVVAGRVHDAWPQAPGRKACKGDADVLLCQCVADGAVALSISAALREPPPIVPGLFRGFIASQRALTQDVSDFAIELDAPMDFQAGQFALVRVPGIDGRRGWSMVDPADGSPRLRFVVKKKPGGAVSDWLFSAPRDGEEVEVFGPLGRATFEPGLDSHLLCIAGGSGIAGMMAILARAVRAGHFTDRDGDVFFGVRTMHDAFYLDELTALRETAGTRLRVTVALSDAPASADDRARYPMLEFDQGFVHEVAASRMDGRLQGVRAYLAGPPPAVDATTRLLLMARVPAADIRFDKFS